MPSRNELNLRAYAMGFDPSTVPNDSKLEQKVLFLEKNQTKTAVTGTAPTTTLTSSGTAADGETLTFNFPDGNTRVYTFKTALTGAKDEVLIGAAATNTLDNLKDAINGTTVSGGQGTTYGTGTVASQHVIAGTKTGTTLLLTSTDTNTNGTLGTTETMANFAFTGATMSAGTLGAAVISNTNTGVRDNRAGVSGDRNTSV